MTFARAYTSRWKEFLLYRKWGGFWSRWTEDSQHFACL